ISNRIKNYDAKSVIINNEIKLTISYDYMLPFNAFKKIEQKKTIISDILLDGFSLENYGLYQEEINTHMNVWDLDNYNRGKNISILLDGFDKFDGTHVDKIENRKIVSIVSCDFRKDTYNNQNELLNKVKNDIQELYRFKEGNVHGTYISQSDYDGKVLNLIIPTKPSDDNLEKQIYEIKNICNSKKIQFKLTIIN
ncbi:MAG: hypothetical protein MJ245_06550, partial [Clostridia bacterium]|nr:hypothetical protein [Clostridia bacterium]